MKNFQTGSVILSIIFVVLLIVILCFGEYYYLSRKSFEQKRVLEKKINEIEAENKQLEKEIQSLKEEIKKENTQN